ncbi:MAG: oxaloacetate decarboxylase [Burkholderiaceae bacterium]
MSERVTRFQDLLARHPVIAAPGAYDALSARVIAQAGYPLVYITGLGNEASDLGFPDLGLTTATEIARRAGNIAQCVDLPVVCDADTGFGGAVNVARTVRQFEAAGVAAIHLEDQTFPKRCGVLAGKTVVPPETFARTLEIALAARRGTDFAIIARTDAKGADGVDGVIARLQRYAQAGVHALMLGDLYTPDEYARIAAAVSLPLIACAADPDHLDQQPDLTLAQWQAAGVRMVVYWHLPLFAAMRAVHDAVTALARDGSAAAVADRVPGYGEYARVVDLERWLRLDDAR